MTDAQKGLVISGTESAHVGSAPEAASIVLEALSSRAAGNGSRFQVVRLVVSEEEYVRRLFQYRDGMKETKAKILAAVNGDLATAEDVAETKGDADADLTEEELAKKEAEAKAREERLAQIQNALSEFAAAFPVPEKDEKADSSGDNGDVATSATETKGNGDGGELAAADAGTEEANNDALREEGMEMSDEDHIAGEMRKLLAQYVAAEEDVLQSLEISPKQLEVKPESVHTDIGYEEEKDPCLQRSLVVDLSSESDSDMSSLVEVVSKVIPPPPASALIADYLAIPAAKTLAIIKKPLGRPTLKPTNKFRLLTLGLPTELVDESAQANAAPGEGSDAANAAAGSGGDDNAVGDADAGTINDDTTGGLEDNFFLKEELSEEQVEALDEDARADYEEKLARRYATRWVLPPRSKIPIGVEFASEEVGAFSRTLSFEIVGRKASYRVPCDAICACPTISKNPRNVFMSRKKRPQRKSKKRSTIVRKAYIASRSRYEFGPLLVGMDRTVAKSKEDASVDEMAADVARRANAESFRITNGDLFPAHVTLAFKDCDADSDDAPFLVSPSELDLEQGETKNVVVWAYPGEDKEFTDVLVCSVKDNPDVVEFPVHCVGGRPKIELHGPWESLASADAARVDGDATSADAAGEKAAADDGVAATPSEPVIDFERLLLKRSEERVLKIDNTCPISIGWRLKCESLDELEEFTITPASGLLHAGKSASVRVNFESIKEQQFEEDIEVEYFAAVDANGRELTSLDDHVPVTVESVSVKVKAEAYDIKYTVPEFHEEDDAAVVGNEAAQKKAKKDGELDFGILRVGESLEKTFTLRNQGKYAIKFDFGIRRKSTKECFTVTPSQGSLDPEGSEEITVKFTSERVVRFKNTKDIRCSVQEPTTGELFESFDLTVSAQSVYSSFRLQPQSGVNFGASHYGNEKTRRIEVRNDGEFEFTYRALKKSVADEGFDALEVVDGTLELGPFTLEPQGGVVAPKESLEILCKFKAEGEAISKETLHISISGRDPKDPRGTVFELSGESCIPGINVTEFETIFEEQAVERRLQEDVAFDSRTLFAVEDGTFSFGSVVPSMLPEQGMAERFKLVNPNKIKAVVDLEVDGNECFAVHPTTVDVPSHESRYVTMYFKPTGMEKYQGKLTATVRDGTDPNTNALSFALLGEGTFPCITMKEPVTVLEDGVLDIDFGRVQAGKSQRRRVTFVNNGVVPATVVFKTPAHQAFSFTASSSRSVTVKPGESSTTYVTFAPAVAREEEFKCEIQMKVLRNDFDITRVRIHGFSFAEDVTLEGLPGDSCDALDFGYLPVVKGARKDIGFELKSHVLHPVKFTFPEDAVFKFSPASGHLQPKSTMSITARFECAREGLSDSTTDDGADSAAASSFEAVVKENELLNLMIQEIKYDTTAPEEKTAEELDAMDDEARSAYRREVAAAKAATTPTNWHSEMANVEQHGTKTIETAVVEPKNENVGEPTEFGIRLSGIADEVTYECDAKKILFKPTLMFSTRAYKFRMKVCREQDAVTVKSTLPTLSLAHALSLTYRIRRIPAS